MKTKAMVLGEEDQRLWYLLCSAFEGGSNYWCMVERLVFPEGKTKADFVYLFDLPFAGGAVKITADGEKKVYTLNRKALDKGWKLMIEKYPHHYADAMTGSGDASTGDVYLQLCLFDDVIFG